MAQKQNNGIDIVKIAFKHKWLRKQFETRANEMTYLFGKDIVFLGIREYCFKRLDEQDQLNVEAEAALVFDNENES